MPLLEVENLHTHFRTHDGWVRAVNGVSFQLEEGETLGLVGESGCGKSVTSLSIMRLIQPPNGVISGGPIRFRGEDLLTKSPTEMRRIRGNAISMIFQEPMTALNPVYTCGFQIMESIQVHQQRSRAEARQQAIEMLRLTGIPSPEQRVDEYPHQLSGGMRQRVMIAMALVLPPVAPDRRRTDDRPRCDGPGADPGLDRASSGASCGMAVLLITHDLGVVAEVADRVAVMYAGRIVEHALVEDIFAPPAPSLYAGPPERHSATRERSRTVGRDPRRGAESGLPARGLRLPSAVPARR